MYKIDRNGYSKVILQLIFFKNMSFEIMSFLFSTQFFFSVFEKHSFFTQTKNEFASLKNKTQFFAKNMSFLILFWKRNPVFSSFLCTLWWLKNSYCQPDPSYVRRPAVLIGPGYACDTGAACSTTRMMRLAFAMTSYCKRTTTRRAACAYFLRIATIF